MATSLTSAGLKTVSDKIIVAARPALEIIKNFTLDVSNDAVKPGTGVVVDVLTASTETFDKSTANYRHATGSIIPVTVATDIRKKATHSLDDTDVINDETSHLWDKFGPVNGRAVGADIIKSVTAKLTYSAALSQFKLGGGANAIALANATLATFTNLRAQVEKAGIDPSTCVLFLLPDAYSALCSLLTAGIVGDGSVIRGAIIGAALGFKAVYSAPTCTDVSGAAVEGVTPKLAVGYIVPENAVAVVNRVVRPLKGAKAQGELIEYGEFTDELTGVVMTQRVVLDSGTGECFWTTEGLFGSKLTREVNDGTANGAPGFWQIIQGS